MASFSSHAQVISRGKGRSAVAAAAYRAGEKIKNEWDGKTHDYRDKQGVIYAEIFTPANVPAWMHDRSTLWNTLEEIEKRKDAQLAREIRVSLPRELTQQQNIQLINDYARLFVREGMIADVAVHDNQDGNPHAHIMLTLRTLEGETFGKKNREWNKSENIEKWREQLATLTNEYLERYGHKDRVDHRSYEEQGIVDKKPTIHLGKTAHQLEQKDIQTDRGNINRAIDAENAYREKAKQALKLIDNAIERERQQEKALQDRERIEKEQQRRQQKEIEQNRQRRLRRDLFRKERKFLKPHQPEKLSLAERAKQDEARQQNFWKRDIEEILKRQSPTEKLTLTQLAEKAEQERIDWNQLAKQLKLERPNWKKLSNQYQKGQIDWNKLKKQQEEQRPDWAKKGDEKKQEREKALQDREKRESETTVHHERGQPHRQPPEFQPSFRERYDQANQRKQERENPNHHSRPPDKHRRTLDDLLQEAQKQVEEEEKQRQQQHDKTFERDP